MPRGGIFGEQNPTPQGDARLAFAAQLLQGGGQGGNFADIMGKALLASRQARMQTQEMQAQKAARDQELQQRQQQIDMQRQEQEAAAAAAANKLERVDLGDSIGLLDAGGHLVGRLPKAATPDAQLGAGVSMRGQDLTHAAALAADLTARYGIDKTAATALAGQMVQMRGQDKSAEIDWAKIAATTGPQRPLTEYDRKARLLFSEMRDASGQYDAATGSDTSSKFNAALGSNPVTRIFTSDDYRKHETAGLRWAQNFLYLKSGQSAPAEEVRKTMVQYLPQPGDGEDVINQKALAREQAMQNVASANSIEYAPPNQSAPANTQFDSVMERYLNTHLSPVK